MKNSITRTLLSLTLIIVATSNINAEDSKELDAKNMDQVESKSTKITEDNDDTEHNKTENNIAKLREEFKRNKSAFVGNAMNLTPEESATFWEIYADYDKERTAIGDKRMELLKEYSKTFTTMTDDKAKELSEDHYEIQKELLELRHKYVTKYQDAMNPITAARFAQVEIQTQLLLDLAIAANLPLIERPVE
jgi:hypothetical protein